MDERLNRWLLEMAQVRRGLTGFVAGDHRIRIDQTEGVDHNLTFDTLYGINDNGDRAFRERFKTRLCVDIDAGQPTAKARMRVIPTNDHFRPDHHRNINE